MYSRLCPCFRAQSEDAESFSNSSVRKKGGRRGTKLHAYGLWRKITARGMIKLPRSTNDGPSGGSNDNVAYKPPACADKIIGGNKAPQMTNFAIYHVPGQNQATHRKPHTATEPTTPSDAFAGRVNRMHLEASTTKISDLGIRKSSSKDGILHRRGLHDASSPHNLMSSDVQRALNGIDMVPYRGSPGAVNVPWQGGVVPLGQVSVDWYLVSAKSTTYTDSFLVVETEDFDLLLGSQIIKDHRFDELA